MNKRIINHLILILAWVTSSIGIADGRVVRGGGGFAEMLAGYAILRLQTEVKQCILPKYCNDFTKLEQIQLKKIYKSLSENSIQLNYKSTCQSIKPTFIFQTSELILESCHIYDIQQKPLDYRQIVKIVFSTLCEDFLKSDKDKNFSCDVLHQKIFSDVMAINQQFTLYQSFFPVSLNVTSISSKNNNSVYFSLEYFNSAYSLDLRLQNETSCKKISFFEIKSLITNIDYVKDLLATEIQVQWTCEDKNLKLQYNGLIVLDVPILEKNVSDKNISFFLSGISLNH